jgi:hypothetical protein
MARQTTITIETRSWLILHDRNSRRGWCPQCAAEGEMISLENKDVISNLDPAVLKEWINSGALHRSGVPDGSSLICLNSLLACVQNAKAHHPGTPQLPRTE